jgi:hypothetical protein
LNLELCFRKGLLLTLSCDPPTQVPCISGNTDMSHPTTPPCLLRWSLANFVLAFNYNPPDLCLLSSWDGRHSLPYWACGRFLVNSISIIIDQFWGFFFVTVFLVLECECKAVMLSMHSASELKLALIPILLFGFGSESLFRLSNLLMYNCL